MTTRIPRLVSNQQQYTKTSGPNSATNTKDSRIPVPTSKKTPETTISTEIPASQEQASGNPSPLLNVPSELCLQIWKHLVASSHIGIQYAKNSIPCNADSPNQYGDRDNPVLPLLKLSYSFVPGWNFLACKGEETVRIIGIESLPVMFTNGKICGEVLQVVYKQLDLSFVIDPSGAGNREYDVWQAAVA